ncbi:hypothetical protein RHMOL_Rhmol09G0042000 [Rhododendron molle]|uniref:Uncharacterized protein n=3 Tax=Rhododendron molle TaxID=49168 RepID=A0ACC0M9P4_RHOML|nr:hypothetical protein RHMOL_Rhmol09G0042000 [Rhododendron molle]KAI8537668.1 hypothetical protein RHMOL_Rhmol09G0042000 [Rhododendron molle]
MADSNKDLLNLENKNSSSSTIESKLLVCKKNEFCQTQNPKPKTPDGMPFTSSVPKSQDFMDMQDNAKDYDIEALTGNESEYIEMDLMLGVADLHTAEAVAAAESAIAGYQPVISLALSSSSSDDNSSSDDESSDDEGSDDDDDSDDGDHLACSPTKIKRSKPLEGDNSTEPSGNDKSKKRAKIVELS